MEDPTERTVYRINYTIVDDLVTRTNRLIRNSYASAMLDIDQLQKTEKNLTEILLHNDIETITYQSELLYNWKAPIKKKVNNIYSLHGFTVYDKYRGLHGVSQSKSNTDKVYKFTGPLIGKVGDLVVSEFKNSEGEHSQYDLIACSEEEKGVKQALLMLLPEIK